MSAAPFRPPRSIWDVLGSELERRVDDDDVIAVDPPPSPPPQLVDDNNEDVSAT